MRRWNPWDDLERFEAEHGTWSDLIAQIDGDATTSPQIKLRKLLSQHTRLIWMCMAYNQGVEAGKREACQTKDR
jgi:hypothetical protein